MRQEDVPARGPAGAARPRLWALGSCTGASGSCARCRFVSGLVSTRGPAALAVPSCPAPGWGGGGRPREGDGWHWCSASLHLGGASSSPARARRALHVPGWPPCSCPSRSLGLRGPARLALVPQTECTWSGLALPWQHTPPTSSPLTLPLLQALPPPSKTMRSACTAGWPLGSSWVCGQKLSDPCWPDGSWLGRAGGGLRPFLKDPRTRGGGRPSTSPVPALPEESATSSDRVDGGRKVRVESGYFSLEKTKQDVKAEEQQLPPPLSPPSPSAPNTRYSGPGPPSPEPGRPLPPPGPQHPGRGVCSSSSLDAARRPQAHVDSGSTGGRGAERLGPASAFKAGRQYATLADVPKAIRISHREAFQVERRRLERRTRARSPGREEVARLFGTERR